MDESKDIVSLLIALKKDYIDFYFHIMTGSIDYTVTFYCYLF